ncbi:MAG TPA: LON peptidase substrate-binding domain-containing protein [Armatimonadota bacterium]|nr:LON peptidase substrate-binding domain-containing protein [Armatimonadota bacterium]
MNELSGTLREAREIPLFPLNVVLFPGMPLPLQVFEERYHRLIEACAASGNIFGVALIREGEEVGGFAEVWPVGTSAHIEQQEALPDGRLKIVTMGSERFEILQRLPDNPYPRAIVRMIDDRGQEVDPDLLREAQNALLRYLRSVARRMGQDWGDLTMPDDPALLGYVAGAVLACSLTEKQEILQAPTPADRLTLAITMIQAEMNRRREVRPYRPSGDISPN